MKKNAASLLIAFLFFGKVYAQEINTAKLDSFFNALGANDKCMGSFAISKHGQVVYQKSIGYREMVEGGKKTVANTTTQYRIGSITKIFTATLIFQLIEQGKLSLDTRLAIYFPQMPNAEIITIGNLLAHTSGLSDYVSDSEDMMWITSPRSKEELLNLIASRKTHFAPGAETKYCNSGYLLLTYILEEITGKPYHKLVNDRIFTKLGLKNTIAGKPNHLGELEAIPYGFLTSWSEIKDIYFPNVNGVGDILSTPNDMLVFINALSAGKLVSLKSLEQMKSFNNRSPFGMGLMRIPFYDKYAIGHGGDTYGSHAVLESFEADGLSFAFCLNGMVYPINDINIAILSICFNKPYIIPSFKTRKVKNEELDVYLGVYASKQHPLKISITKQGQTLMGQATGQSAFPLETTTKDTFKFDNAGILIEFVPQKGEMILKQKGMEFLFVKENGK